jgi:hypothetical protein
MLTPLILSSMRLFAATPAPEHSYLRQLAEAKSDLVTVAEKMVQTHAACLYTGLPRHHSTVIGMVQDPGAKTLAEELAEAAGNSAAVAHKQSRRAAAAKDMEAAMATAKAAAKEADAGEGINQPSPEDREAMLGQIIDKAIAWARPELGSVVPLTHLPHNVNRLIAACPLCPYRTDPQGLQSTLWPSAPSPPPPAVTGTGAASGSRESGTPLLQGPGTPAAQPAAGDGGSGGRLDAGAALVQGELPAATAADADVGGDPAPASQGQEESRAGGSRSAADAEAGTSGQSSRAVKETGNNGGW